MLFQGNVEVWFYLSDPSGSPACSSPFVTGTWLCEKQHVNNSLIVKSLLVNRYMDICRAQGWILQFQIKIQTWLLLKIQVNTNCVALIMTSFCQPHWHQLSYKPRLAVLTLPRGRPRLTDPLCSYTAKWQFLCFLLLHVLLIRVKTNHVPLLSLVLMVSVFCFVHFGGEKRIDIILTSDPGEWIANPGCIIQAHSDCKYQSRYANFLLIEIIYVLFYASSKASWTKCTFIICTFPFL